MYKGELEGFPEEIVEWMLDNQVKQGNPRDVSVFGLNIEANAKQKGFDWDQTSEDSKFCRDVIASNKFNIFFEKYPRKPIQTSEYPKLMRVSDIAPINANNLSEDIAVVFHYQPNLPYPYFAYSTARSLSDVKTYGESFVNWQYAKDIEPEPEFPKELQTLVDKKADEDNQIDLDTYAKGLLDCYNSLVKK